ncbi:MAG: hypothetical protein ACO3GK_05820 [Bacteroidia bacterium]
MLAKRLILSCLWIMGATAACFAQVTVSELMKLRPISVGLHPTPKSANIIYLEMGCPCPPLR